MVISVIGIRFCCQLYLRRLGERESGSESDSESDSADTEVFRTAEWYACSANRTIESCFHSFHYSSMGYYR